MGKNLNSYGVYLVFKKKISKINCAKHHKLYIKKPWNRKTEILRQNPTSILHSFVLSLVLQNFWKWRGCINQLVFALQCKGWSYAPHKKYWKNALNTKISYFGPKFCLALKTKNAKIVEKYIEFCYIKYLSLKFASLKGLHYQVAPI